MKQVGKTRTKGKGAELTSGFSWPASPFGYPAPHRRRLPHEAISRATTGLSARGTPSSLGQSGRFQIPGGRHISRLSSDVGSPPGTLPVNGRALPETSPDDLPAAFRDFPVSRGRGGTVQTAFRKSGCQMQPGNLLSGDRARRH